MKVKLKLSRVGMNMEEATIAQWHRKPGDQFNKGDPLYSIETEKVTQDIEAESSGTLLEILVPVGGTAMVGENICIVDLKLSE